MGKDTGGQRNKPLMDKETGVSGVSILGDSILTQTIGKIPSSRQVACCKEDLCFSSSPNANFLKTALLKKNSYTYVTSNSIKMNERIHLF